MGKNAPRRAGFTLIEILAVTAIVGTLAALLLPSLSTAREKSRATACIGNLRQLGQATILYHDNFGVLPSGTSSGYFLWNGTQYVLYGQLLQVFDRSLSRAFYCPAAAIFNANDPTTGLQNLGLPGQITAGNYYARSPADGAPRRLVGPPVTLLADIFFSAGSARNHAGGVNTLSSDGAVRYQSLPGNWNIAASNSWLELDRRGL